MIFVLAGTRDGREIAAALADAAYPVIASVVSGYGRELVEMTRSTLEINDEPLNKDAMLALFQARRIRLVIDASHPYAVNVSQTAVTVCQSLGIAYLRYERPTAPLPPYDKLTVVPDYQAAVDATAMLGQTVFLTTGSRQLAVFKTAASLQNHRLIARVLPEAEVIAECRALGFLPRDIVAMQGPFSHALNIAIFREYQAEVVVTKNSGQVGGTDTKISAAMELGLSLVVIDRPNLSYGQCVHDLTGIMTYVEEAY